MKKRYFTALLALGLMLFSIGAQAQEIDPSRECFSPGLTLIEQAGTGAGMELEASFEPEAMLSTNKTALSVLKALFAMSSVRYRTNGEEEYAALCIDGEPRMELTLARDADAIELSGNVLPYALHARDEAALYYALGMNASFAQILAQSGEATPVHIALPRESGEATLTQEAFDALCAQSGLEAVYVTQPVQIAWTADENGTFTGATLEGAVALSQDEAAYAISAKIRASASKLTCEAELTRDKQNTLTLSVSVTRTDTAATRSKKAQSTIDARITLKGKIEGYSRTLNVTAKGTNTWERSEETGVLSEQISHTLKIGYTDKNPAMRHIDLSNVAVTLKDKVQVQSAQSQSQAQSVSDVEISLEGSTLLSGTLSATMRTLETGETVLTAVNAADHASVTAGEAATAGEAQAAADFENLTAQQLLEIRDDLSARMADFMRDIYEELPSSAQETIEKGLTLE